MTQSKKQPEWQPSVISKPSVLFVEGKDEVGFLAKLLKAMGLDEMVQLLDVGGKEAFAKHVQLQVNSNGFEPVTRLGIIRDADESVVNTFESIKTTLQQCKTPKGESLAVPSRPNEFVGDTLKVGIFIMPDNCQNGALEDLCLNIIKDVHRGNLPCVNDFVNCLNPPPPHKIGKVKVQALLASIYEHDGKADRIITHVGTAAERGYWDFESESLSALKQYLENFRLPSLS